MFFNFCFCVSYLQLFDYHFFYLQLLCEQNFTLLLEVLEYGTNKFYYEQTLLINVRSSNK